MYSIDLYNKMEIIKKFDNQLKKFIYYCRYKNISFKFIDSSCDNSMEIAKITACQLYKHI